jgi:hypothetical protein
VGGVGGSGACEGVYVDPPGICTARGVNTASARFVEPMLPKVPVPMHLIVLDARITHVVR